MPAAFRRMKDERVAASKILTGPKPADRRRSRKAFIEDVRHALYCSKIISYAQGYMLLREAAKEQKWNLNYGGIALMWRGGCIIRSRFLGKIKEAYDKNPQLTNLLLDDFFSKTLNEYQASWRTRDRQARSKPAFRRRPSPPRSRSTTATAPSGCRRTCCRRSAITSARTPTSASTSRAASSSTPTGPAAAAASLPALTTFNATHSGDVNDYGLNIRKDGALDFLSLGRTGPSPGSGHHPVSQGA